jgi:hypothetical protein
MGAEEHIAILWDNPDGLLCPSLELMYLDSFGGGQSLAGGMDNWALSQPCCLTEVDSQQQLWA